MASKNSNSDLIFEINENDVLCGRGKMILFQQCLASFVSSGSATKFLNVVYFLTRSSFNRKVQNTVVTMEIKGIIT